MNFFERQAQARRRTTRLVLLFALAVAGIVVAMDAVVLAAYGPNPVALAVATVLTLAIIGIGSLYRMATLRGGGDAVALQFGGVPVPEQTTDRHLRRLRNVAEEIAIASGVPMPRLYVLENDDAINAFAAGYGTSDAVIAVTRGALEALNRDELQGVVAHEFSHVLNGDMRLNLRLVGVLFGILMISLIGRRILMVGGGRGRGAVLVLGSALAAMLVGSLGLFFARMIKAGVSRSREHLADASAVQFTRQTSGLAGALKKIAGVPAGSRLVERSDAEEVSHMLFGDGVGLSGWFATHPPILSRIQALDPSFRADHMDALGTRWRLQPPDGLQEDVRLGLDGPSGARLPQADAQFQVTAPMVAAQVARPHADDHRRADAIVEAAPPALAAAARDREAVMPLLLALLLDDAADVRAKQRMEIVARMGAPVADAADALHGGMDGLHPMQRLPLAALAFPVLRLRPRPQLDTFLDVVHAMVHADGAVSLFEYCLGRLLAVQVRESLEPGRHAAFGRRKPGSVRTEFATLLSVVAQAGHGDPASAQRAYLAGLQRVLPRDHVAYAPPAAGVLALDPVWAPLDALDPLAKQVLVEAVTDAVSHDGRISVAESELLRTICAVLHCPLPPMLEQR
ncbi:MAG TPA: M48 family metallopeptidase [Luteimonas sp.]|nr:M48 family metallopeptidase [Luteimonas sp.]